MVASGDWSCSFSWPKSERRIQSLWVIWFYFFLPPKALEMVGSDVLLKQPQDEEKQTEMKTELTHILRQLAIFFLSVNKLGWGWQCYSFYGRCSLYPQPPPRALFCRPHPLIPPRKLTTGHVFSGSAPCLLWLHLEGHRHTELSWENLQENVYLCVCARARARARALMMLRKDVSLIVISSK